MSNGTSHYYIWNWWYNTTTLTNLEIGQSVQQQKMCNNIYWEAWAFRVPLKRSFASLSSLCSLVTKSMPSNVTLEFLYWLPKAVPNPHPRPTPIPQPPPISNNCETCHQEFGRTELFPQKHGFDLVFTYTKTQEIQRHAWGKIKHLVRWCYKEEYFAKRKRTDNKSKWTNYAKSKQIRFFCR